MSLYYDLMRIIFEKLDVLSQIRYRQIASFVYTNIHMTKFSTVNIEFLKKLTDNILLKYPFCKELDASFSDKISNLNHLKCLRILRISEYAGQNAINELYELDELTIRKPIVKKYRTLISDLNHLKKLRKLDASYTNLPQTAISDIYELVELNIKHNPHITNINHLVKLKKLIASGYCAIDQKGFSNLREIVVLDITGKNKINSVKHLTKLKKLDAWRSGISQLEINELCDSKQIKIRYTIQQIVFTN